MKFVIFGRHHVAFILYLQFALSLLTADYSAAQTSTASGTRGWCTVGSGPEGQCFSDIQASCVFQYEAFHCESCSPILSYVDTGNPFVKTCSWTYNGGTAPTNTIFYCQDGYHADMPGVCVNSRDPYIDPPACSANNGGTVNPASSNPINIATGSKLFYKSDFSTADGNFKVERRYNSFAYRGAITFENPTAGSGMMWNFNFSPELHLGDGFSNFQQFVAAFLPDGTVINFTYAGNKQSKMTLKDSNQQLDWSLYFDGNWPDNFAEIETAKSRWHLVDSGGTRWDFETFVDSYSPYRYHVARPVKMTRRDGYIWSYTYGSRNELSGIADSFGRNMQFEWEFVRDIPHFITKIRLPNSSLINYTYQTVLSGNQADNRRKRLVKVDRIDSSSTVLDTTSYLYENGMFPFNITGVTDARNIRTNTVVYDDRGRAVSSALAGDMNKFAVDYVERTNNVNSRVVTNALGKKTTYNYAFHNMFSPFAQLQNITGDPSTNCVGSVRAYQYDGNDLISAEIDDEGRKTTFTRDAVGRPLSITRGAP